MSFRALWPITDPTISFPALCQQAWEDVPHLLLQAKARPTGHGRWSSAPSSHVPGSGRVTDWVLIYECEAVKVVRRSISQGTARPESKTPPSIADRAELLALAVERGDSIHRVCGDLSVTRQALARWCQRHGLTETFATLSERAGDYAQNDQKKVPSAA